MEEIALRYANGLYSIALETKQVNEMQESIKTIHKLLMQNLDFIDVISSAFVSLEEKEKIIDNTFKGVDLNIVNYMKLMVRNRRQRYLLDSLQAFNSLCNEYRGVKEGLIYSTKYLDEKTLNKIIKKISELEGQDVELINKIDPLLIGGVRVVISGHIYDGSIKTHLMQLKESLLK